MTWFAHTRCDCGAPLTITSDSRTGATIEICDGCGYCGPARPRMDLPLRLAAPSDCPRRKMCAEGCGRPAAGPRALRCDDCGRRVHLTQREAAKSRMARRRAGESVPLLRQKRAS